MDAILVILEEAKAYLRESGVDQWQEGYPNREAVMADIAAGRGWAFEHEGRIAGYECVSMQPEECSYRGIDGRWLSEGENYAGHTPRHGGGGIPAHLALRARLFSLAEDLRRRDGEAERPRGHPPRQTAR